MAKLIDKAKLKNAAKRKNRFFLMLIQRRIRRTGVLFWAGRREIVNLVLVLVFLATVLVQTCTVSQTPRCSDGPFLDFFDMHKVEARVVFDENKT